jgi:NAD(P)-dependent dehydrogenase (short-subunit alcohol dehydrogenase family)
MSSAKVRFDGKAILVTGAGRGMGREHVLLLASRGAKVVVSDNGTAVDGSGASSAPADSVVAEIKRAGGQAVACAADLSTESGSIAAVQTCIDAFGRIDGLLHNASISPDMYGASEIPTEALDLVMRVNVYGGFWLTREAWPHMKNQGGGRIVYTSSHAIYGVGGSAPYAASKSALIGMARSFALEGKLDNILCNILVPSASTRMTSRIPPSEYKTWLAKTMDPAKVAVGAAYLLCDECMANGEMFSIGGGRIARIMLAEASGLMDLGGSVEQVRDQFEIIRSQKAHYFPVDLNERVSAVHKSMGFEGVIGAKAYDIISEPNK